MLTPRKLIAFLTLALVFFSTLVWADCSSLGSGWVQGSSSGGVTTCIPTGDNPTGAISSGDPVLTENGKEYYAPPSTMADKVQVDSSGRIARTLDEITRITRADGSTYVYTTSTTFYTEAGAASSAVWDKVKADPSAFPTLKSALDAALANAPPPSTGDVISTPTGNQLIGPVAGGMQMTMSCTNWASVSKQHVYSTYVVNYVAIGGCADGPYGYNNTQNFMYEQHNLSPTSLSVTPVDINFNPATFTDQTTGPLAASEIDNLISQNPDSFKKSYTPSANEGLTSPPIPTALTPERIAEIYAGNGAPTGTGSPTIGPSGTPTLPPPVDIPQTPLEGSDPSAPPPSPDIYGPGYTPGFNGSPYGSSGPGGVEFGDRLSQFMTDLQGSSLFSLPTSILGNIPSSGTSVISFDGGEFGQQSFDFAAFSNQLMVIRSVLLLCFSLLSIRIVTLKR